MANSEVRIVIQSGMTRLDGGWDWRPLVAYRVRRDTNIVAVFTTIEQIADLDTRETPDRIAARCSSCGHRPGCECTCCYDGAPVYGYVSDPAETSGP
jgi:hypothetical protein